MTIHWDPLRELIASHQRFVLSSHVRPDADALGSELGMAALLEALHKDVRIVNPSSSPANLLFLDPARRVQKLGEGVTAAELCEADVHVILDTSAWGQLAELGSVIKQTRAKKVLIDHHVSSDDLGAMEFKDTNAEATGALVFQLFRDFGVPIPKPAAEALFCAIATDTGWFRFPSTTANTLRIAGDLIDAGANPTVLFQSLYEQATLSRTKLAGRVLSSVQLDCDGQLAYVTVTQQDFAETGSVPADTEDLVNECLKIAGTRAAFIAIEQPTKTVKVSFRSRVGLNVAEVAERFHGGGHKQAAGAILPGPLPSAIAQVLAAMKEALAQNSSS
jgi:phosphoesterase RecJ-like protein